MLLDLLNTLEIRYRLRSRSWVRKAAYQFLPMNLLWMRLEPWMQCWSTHTRYSNSIDTNISNQQKYEIVCFNVKVLAGSTHCTSTTLVIVMTYLQTLNRYKTRYRDTLAVILVFACVPLEKCCTVINLLFFMLKSGSVTSFIFAFSSTNGMQSLNQLWNLRFVPTINLFIL